MVVSTQVNYKDLRDAVLFKQLPDQALIELAKHCRYVELPGGDFLFQQDDPADTLYILTDGQIHIVRHYSSGEDVILATETPYYVIGELSTLAGQPRTGGVLAVTDCTLIALDRDAFMDVCENVPNVAVTVQNYLAKRIYRMNLLVREHALGNVAARVASVVLLLSNENDEVRINRVARAVGIESDAVERLFKEWTQHEIISYSNRNLVVHDREMLRNIAG